MINIDWLRDVDQRATDCEKGIIGVDALTTDQLQYLVYWNWGYSGVTVPGEVKRAKAELEKRGTPYSHDYAERLDAAAEKFYSAGEQL